MEWAAQRRCLWDDWSREKINNRRERGRGRNKPENARQQRWKQVTKSIVEYLLVAKTKTNGKNWPSNEQYTLFCFTRNTFYFKRMRSAQRYSYWKLHALHVRGASFLERFWEAVFDELRPSTWKELCSPGGWNFSTKANRTVWRWGNSWRNRLSRSPWTARHSPPGPCSALGPIRRTTRPVGVTFIAFRQLGFRMLLH